MWIVGMLLIIYKAANYALRFVKIDRFVNDMPMPTLEKTINNYVGVGVDAKVTLTFHHFREAYPNFCSSLVNNSISKLSKHTAIVLE